jgi:hypothetical protein
MKFNLFFLCLLALSINSIAKENTNNLVISTTAPQQSQWQVGQYYASKGQVWTEWRNVFTGYYDFYGNPIYQKQCHQTKWYSEYRAGYYYVWNGFQYVSQWYEGTQWYCTWSAWYNC